MQKVDPHLKYLDCWFFYRITKYIHIFSLYFKKNDKEPNEIYRDKVYDEVLNNALNIINVSNAQLNLNVDCEFIIKSETCSFKIENKYDAAHVIKNWWYFKNFDVFNNSHITKEIFTEWCIYKFKISKIKNNDTNEYEIDELVQKSKMLDIDYVTFIY